jgi:hypothetical protein
MLPSTPWFKTVGEFKVLKQKMLVTNDGTT